ncbi:MAG: hypothetical protein JWL83_4413 [Actinomycetia bacterium]|nr:hypothetical protein [Actinomycetes bacterium]
MRAATAAVVVLFALALVAGCSSKTNHDISVAAKSAANDIKRAATTHEAEVVAQAFRADVKVRAEQNKRSARSVNLLRAAAHDMSGMKVTGITDTNKDHLDDDCKVQIQAANGFACVTITPDGNNTSVKGGKC